MVERNLRRDGVGRDEKDQAGRKEREQNNLNIENVYDLG